MEYVDYRQTPEETKIVVCTMLTQGLATEEMSYQLKVPVWAVESIIAACFVHAGKQLRELYGLDEVTG